MNSLKAQRLDFKNNYFSNNQFLTTKPLISENRSINESNWSRRSIRLSTEFVEAHNE